MILFYSKMNKVDYTTFVKGKTYYIHAHYKEEKDKKYIGEFSHNQDVEYFGGRHYFTFRNVKSITENLSARYLSFCVTDTYYDVEEIRENAQRAIQNMEQRSVNMILKRLINEEFQWY